MASRSKALRTSKLTRPERNTFGRDDSPRPQLESPAGDKPMDVEQAIKMYRDEIWERFAADNMSAALESMRYEFERRGLVVSAMDWEFVPEGVIWMNIYRKGSAENEGPEVCVTLMLADSYLEEGETEGPYRGVDIVIEVKATRQHESAQLLRTYATGGQPAWTTDHEEIVRRIHSIDPEHIANVLAPALERRGEPEV
jgi:hypothetical protein